MKTNEWEIWFDNVKKGSLLVENFLNTFTIDEDNLIDFETLWQKVSLLKFFIEHLCHIDKLIYVRCFTLWKEFDNLENPVDFKRIDCFTKLLKFISLLSTAILRKYTAECKGKI